MFNANIKDLLCITYGVLSSFYKSEFYRVLSPPTLRFSTSMFIILNQSHKLLLHKLCSGSEAKEEMANGSEYGMGSWRRGGQDSGSVNPF